MKNTKDIKTGTIKQSVFINAPPEKIYQAFIDAKLHTAFTGSKATGSGKLGAQFTSWGGYAMGKNLELKKGKRIVQTWKTTEWPDGYDYSVLKLTLVKKGKGTLLTMVHSKVPKSQMKEYASGWKDYYWKPLKEYVE